MARFVDLEMDDEGGNGQEPPSSGSSALHHLPTAGTPLPAEACPTVTTSMTPAVCNAITRAFQCYPYVLFFFFFFKRFILETQYLTLMLFVIIILELSLPLSRRSTSTPSTPLHAPVVGFTMV